MSADRLAEIKARAEAATPGPSMVLNARLLSGDVFIEHAREDVPWLVKQVERAEAEVEWWKERFPCDGLCSDAPEEDCSRHGRVPADLWGIIGKLSAERDALAQIKRHIDEVRNGTGWTVQIYGVLLQQCDQYGKTIDTRRADKAEAERDALRETVGRVQALVDSNPDHADTCGSVLTPGADYPCSCWQTDLRAALATTEEGQ